MDACDCKFEASQSKVCSWWWSWIQVGYLHWGLWIARSLRNGQRLHVEMAKWPPTCLSQLQHRADKFACKITRRPNAKLFTAANEKSYQIRALSLSIEILHIAGHRLEFCGQEKEANKGSTLARYNNQSSSSPLESDLICIKRLPARDLFKLLCLQWAFAVYSANWNWSKWVESISKSLASYLSLFFSSHLILGQKSQSRPALQCKSINW